MSDNHSHRRHYPEVLTRFKGLPGEYGTLEVRAQSASQVRLQTTGEFLDLNRNDAQEMIRVLSAWLARPVSRIVVDNDGGDTTVVLERDGNNGARGAQVVVVEDEREERSHVDHRRPT